MDDHGGGNREEEETLEAAEARCVAAFESALALVQAEPDKAKVRETEEGVSLPPPGVEMRPIRGGRGEGRARFRCFPSMGHVRGAFVSARFILVSSSFHSLTPTLSLSLSLSLS